MTKEQTSAFVDAASQVFSEDYRQKLAVTLGMQPVAAWTDILKVILSLFTQLGPILALFQNCPPAPTPVTPPKPPIN